MNNASQKASRKSGIGRSVIRNYKQNCSADIGQQSRVTFTLTASRTNILILVAQAAAFRSH